MSETLAAVFGLWCFVALFGICADDEFLPYLMIFGFTASVAIIAH